MFPNSNISLIVYLCIDFTCFIVIGGLYNMYHDGVCLLFFFIDITPWYCSKFWNIVSLQIPRKLVLGTVYVCPIGRLVGITWITNKPVMALHIGRLSSVWVFCFCKHLAVLGYMACHILRHSKIRKILSLFSSYFCLD